MRPHRRQPTRLLCPWDSPGKNTGVGCHFLLQCMKVKIESEVAQSCPTLSGPMDCSLAGSSVHGIFQARVLEWGAIAFSSSDTTYLEIVSDSQVKGPVPQGCPHPSLWYNRSEVPITPSSSLINLLKWLTQKNTELRETFYLLDYQLIIKGHNSRRARWKRYTGQGTGKGHEIHMPSPGTPFSSPLHMFTSPETLQMPSFGGFMEASLHRHYWWNHWSLEVGGGGGGIFSLLIPHLVSLPTSLHP